MAGASATLVKSALVNAALGKAASDAVGQRTLSHWLRLLFDRAPTLHFDSDVPFIAAGSVHLPPQPHWRLDSAAAAHAVAHLVYSPREFDGTGLAPIARALLGLFEDARVESLAMRELPGLARLWRPLHTATPVLGTGFEALLQRLARALVDPGYDDPDAWVRKGRALFFLDAGLGLPALRTPAELRQAAMRLGHDVGQMRLQLNAKTYRPEPAYRDDHRWMWAADVAEAAASIPPPPAAVSARARHDGEDPPPPDANAIVVRHPEWDRLISRLRPDWCTVVEQRAHRAASARFGDASPPESLADTTLREPLRALARQHGRAGHSDEGDAFDAGALVDWRIACRLRIPADARVYRSLDVQARRVAVWLLVDSSASTVASLTAGGPSVLHTASQAAAATARALQSNGVSCAVAAFASHGRHAVHMQVIKAFDESADAAMEARLYALRPGGSTRLGAVLRHAASRFEGRSDGARWVIVFSDGEPHDIDVHDPRLLVEDARHAVRDAARRSVRVVCVALEAQRGADALRIFGRRGVAPLHDPAQLAQAFRRLLGQTPNAERRTVSRSTASGRRVASRRRRCRRSSGRRGRAGGSAASAPPGSRARRRRVAPRAAASPRR